jgi:hypothetical protein
MGEKRLIVGNLDCEVDFAREEAAAAGRRADARLALPPAVLETISAAATLLRAFARDGDTLWTPRPVAPQRIARVRGLPAPNLASGPLAELSSSRRLLAWGETEVVARLRDCRSATADADDTPRGLDDGLWRSPPAQPAVARAINDRAFALEVAHHLGVALPGAVLVSDLGALERHLAGGGARASAGGRWVLKARFSAAGRSRLLGRGERLDDLERRRAEKLLAVHGALLFEPWMDRSADFGACALVAADRVELLGVHDLEVDAAGRFTGIVLPAPRGSAGSLPLLEAAGLDAAERQALESVLTEVAEEAGRRGYRGALEVDCWRYRDCRGEARFHPLGEINARMSFGLVAHALRERLAREHEWVATAPVRLGFGTPPPAPKGVESIALLDAEPSGHGGAWLERAVVE